MARLRLLTTLAIIAASSSPSVLRAQSILYVNDSPTEANDNTISRTSIRVFRFDKRPTIAMVPSVVPSEIRGVNTAGGVAGAPVGSTRVYSNDVNPVTRIYSPGANQRVADDLLLANGACNAVYYNLATYFTGPVGTTYTVNTELWTGDPCLPGSAAIAGTAASFQVSVPTANDRASFLEAETASPIPIPATVWLAATFSRSDAFWIIAGQAEIGSTQNLFSENDTDANPDVCAQFVFTGTTPPYAGFWAEMYCESFATPTGACCLDDGDCTVTTSNDCSTNLNGGYQGDATLCQVGICPQPGTCCASDGTCTVLLENQCLGAVWVVGGNCNPNPCPQPGACCEIDGSCDMTLLSDCGSALWVEGTACTPNRCPIPPIVAPLGPRYLSVTPQAWDPSEPVAIRISSPQYPCLSKYVALDSGIGRVIDDPVFLPASAWGTVRVADAEIVPATTYEVQTETAIGLSYPASATTPLWCDVGDPIGILNALDIVAFVYCFKSVPGAPPPEACDVYPAVPDQVINALDITIAVDALKEFPYPFPLPCN